MLTHAEIDQTLALIAQGATVPTKQKYDERLPIDA